MNPRRLPILTVKRVLLVIGAGLVILVLTLPFMLDAFAERRWAALERQTTEIIANAQARDPRRPVLRGIPTPGNAWDDYVPMIAEAEALNRNLLGTYVYTPAKADPDQARRHVEAHLDLLPRLAAGAGREEGGYRWVWSRGLEGGSISGEKARLLAIARSRFLRETYRRAEARDLLLDALQFALDEARSNKSSATSGLVSASYLLAELSTLPPDADIARALKILDDTFPDMAACFLEEVAVMVITLQVTPPDRLESLLNETNLPLRSWRHGFRERLILADTAATYLASARRYARELSRTFAEIQRFEKELAEQVDADTNPLTHAMFKHFPLNYIWAAQCRALIRILRRHHGETADLDDPFGGKIRSDGRRIWSIGPNGIDDGGKGILGWQIDGDIVLDPGTK